MGCESSDVVRFNLGPLLQGQMRVTKLKSAYNKMLFIFKTMLVGLFRWIYHCIWPQMHPWSSLKMDFVECEPNPQCGTCSEPAMVVLETIHPKIVCLVFNNVPLGRN